jgi:hypothetical protein
MASLRQLLSGKVRSQSGCYTCRLRRKKCDEKRPICDGCSVLEIDCHFGEEKPEWMDGGPKQRMMAETIKAQVKKQARQRRDRKYLELLEHGTRMVSLGDNDGKSTKRSGLVTSSDTDHAHETSPGSNSHTTGTSPDMPWHNQLFKAGEEKGYDSKQDTHMIMIYADFVFPYLFPHYRPPLLVGGRGWVLDVLLNSSRSIYYTAISLSSWFFGVLLAGGAENHESCTNRMEQQLQRQMEISLTELQKNIVAINAKKPAFDIREGLTVLQCVLQMLIVEVATGTMSNWKMHLDAAMALFHQILPNPESWSETLHSLWTPKWPPPEMGVRRPWSTAQASLRFFGANLLYMDVMSSIAMSTAPRLYNYQSHVIPGCPDFGMGVEPQPARPLLMQEFFGLYNWVIQMLSEIASLDAYKKEQKRAGSLCMSDIVIRGSVLAETIRSNIQHLESQSLVQDPVDRALSLAQDPLASLNPTNEDANPAFLVHNLIWLHAALIYLNTVMSGWQPSSPEIQCSVAKATELMWNIPGGKTLQSMAFPFCVVGCLAPPEEHDKFREMVTRLGPLQVFGTIKESKLIMEKVWASTGQVDENWDIAKCLNIHGYSVLLF